MSYPKWATTLRLSRQVVKERGVKSERRVGLSAAVLGAHSNTCNSTKWRVDRLLPIDQFKHPWRSISMLKSKQAFFTEGRSRIRLWRMKKRFSFSEQCNLRCSMHFSYARERGCVV